MEKVIIEILNEKPDYHIPYGKKYEAKGAYRQGKYIIAVGVIEKDGSAGHTMRIKYPAKDVKVTLI